MQTVRKLCRAGSANAASNTWQSGAVRLVNRIPPVWLVISGIISVQFGAAIAKDLFHLIPPTAMVWLRLISSAAILLIMVRPRLTGHSGRDWLVVLGFGLSLMTMNWAIYQSFARIPLGVAVTIEFLGPLAVAVVGSRRLADLIWVVLAAIGVALLGVSRTTRTSTTRTSRRLTRVAELAKGANQGTHPQPAGASVPR
jgi:inner membrane transporter RhtA